MRIRAVGAELCHTDRQTERPDDVKGLASFAILRAWIQDGEHG